MMPLSELLKKVLTLYSTNFKIIIGILLINLVWTVATSTIPVSLATTLRFALPTLIVSMILYSFTELALINGYAHFIEQKPAALREILTTALKKLPGFILILILWTAIMTVGTLLFIVPAVIFGVWFMFAGTVLMLENVHAFPAFKRSRALTVGFFLPLLWRGGAIIFATFFVAIAATQGLFSILAALLGPDNVYGIVVGEIFGALLATLILPIINGTVVALYFEMKKIKS